jgi:uncharacterized phage-associated protein
MFSFNEKKAAQLAAYFVRQSGGSTSVLKLMKLMYLAERLSYKKFGESLTGDKLVSMEHGPVLSLTLNHINGARKSEQGGWESWIADRENHTVSLRDPSMLRTPEQDLTQLSESDLEVAVETWVSFGHFDQYRLRDYTHAHCPEWEDPDGSSRPIEFAKLLTVLGYTPDTASELMQRAASQVELDQAFSR